MRQGCTRRARTRWATRRVMTRVFPDPAPASTSSGPSGASTASRWGGLRSESSSSGLETGDVTLAGLMCTSGKAAQPEGRLPRAMHRPSPTLEELAQAAERFNRSAPLLHAGIRLSFPSLQLVVAEVPDVRPEHRGGMGTSAVN